MIKQSNALKCLFALFCITIFAYFGNFGYAATKDGTFAIRGAGFSECQEFLDAKESRTPRYFQFGGWINGYLTATNETLAETFDLTAWENADTIAEYVANYCTQKPNHRFIFAVKELVKALMNDRITAQTELVDIRNNEFETILYKETIFRIQRKLSEMKLYSGAKDGAYSKELSDAIAKFQARESLRKTGFPTQETLHVLFR